MANEGYLTLPERRFVNNTAFTKLVITLAIGLLVSLLSFNAWYMWEQGQDQNKVTTEVRIQQMGMQKDITQLQVDVGEQSADIKDVKRGVEALQRTLSQWEPVANVKGL